MSTDWGIGCRTCRDGGAAEGVYFTGAWDNCRSVEGLLRLIDAREVIVATHVALGEQVRFTWSTHGFYDSNAAVGLPKFLAAHAGHALAPMDEYGGFHDECWQRVKCGGCGHSHRCLLPLNHPPPCSLGAPAAGGVVG